MLQDIFKQLPTRINAAFIVITHLQAHTRSHLVDLLTPFTNMPLDWAHENEVIFPGHVYLLPVDKMMTVKHGRLCLVNRTPRQKINRAINIFFESMGEELKSRAIGIVLTGSGTDGVQGTATIHSNGGIIMVQKPSTAQFADMPQSIIDDDHPNFVMAPHELIETLMEFIKPSN